MKKSVMTSPQVLAALREGPFREGGYAWLYEVKNGTGWQRQDRFADALVVSCWPSRGIHFAGIEVKVDRSDWRRELDNPRKSAEIQRWCDYWWVAAPEGVVEIGEVPETWGLTVVSGKKVTTAKQAPKLEAEAPTPTFVASILRNQSQGQETAKRAGYDEGWLAAKDGASEEKFDQLRGQVVAEQTAKEEVAQKLKWLEREHAVLKDSVKFFERSAGIGEGDISRNRGYMGAHPIGEHLKAAEILATNRPEKLAEVFRELASGFDALVQAQKGAA